MSTTMDEYVKRWTTRLKSALVLDIIQGKTTVSKATRQFDLSPSEIEEWVDQGKAGMEDALRAKPEDIREQYERDLRDLQEAYGEAMLGLRAQKKSSGLKQKFITPHCPQQNGMIERVIRTLKEQYVHRHRFESIQYASRAIGDWIHFYNNRRPHQALGMKTPAEVFRLTA